MRLPSLCLLAGLVVAAALELSGPLVNSAVARTWTSDDGVHTIEAELVRSTGDQVLLKKPNGDIIPVPLAKLSIADRQYVAAERAKAMQPRLPGTPVAIPMPVVTPVEKPVEKPAETATEKPTVEREIDITRIRTYDRLNDVANRCARAEQVVKLFGKFLEQPGIEESELLSAKNHLPAWEAKAAKKMVRIGTNWLEPAEAAKIREKAQTMVKEGREMLDAGQIDGARSTLRNASKTDPEDAHADFLIGLSYALVSHDATNARSSFSECLRRRPGFVPAMNNLALADVRMRAYDDALHQWQLALAAGPASREISQNLGRLAALAGKKVVPLSQVMLRRVNDLQASVSSGKSFDPRVGWLYMPYDPSDITGNTRTTSRHRDTHLGEDRWCMRCGGTGTVHCPNRECKSGKVPGGTVRSIKSVGPSPKFHVDTQVWKTCPECHGKKLVDCQDCIQGVDKDLH